MAGSLESLSSKRPAEEQNGLVSEGQPGTTASLDGEPYPWPSTEPSMESYTEYVHGQQESPSGCHRTMQSAPASGRASWAAHFVTWPEPWRRSGGDSEGGSARCPEQGGGTSRRGKSSDAACVVGVVGVVGGVAGNGRVDKCEKGSSRRRVHGSWSFQNVVGPKKRKPKPQRKQEAAGLLLHKGMDKRRAPKQTKGDKKKKENRRGARSSRSSLFPC